MQLFELFLLFMLLYVGRFLWLWTCLGRFMLLYLFYFLCFFFVLIVCKNSYGFYDDRVCDGDFSLIIEVWQRRQANKF